MYSNFFLRARHLLKLALCFLAPLLFWSFWPMRAQAPTDEWRRNGIDPMVAEPDGTASLLSNPAGLKSKKLHNNPKKLQSAEREYITEVLSINIFIDKSMAKILSDPNQFNLAIYEHFEPLTNIAENLGGANLEDDPDKILNLLQGLPPEIYRKIVAGTRFLSRKNPDNVALRDLKLEAALGNAASIADNIPELLKALSESLGEEMIGPLSTVGMGSYARLFGLSYSDDSNTIAWGLYIGFEQSMAIRFNTENAGLALSFFVDEVESESLLPIGLKFYLLTPLRLAFATDFADAIPGLTLGLGLKVVPYNGFNHYSFGPYFSKNVSINGIVLNDQTFIDAFYGAFGINLGADLGLQYHFGSITSKLDFLHVGLKISDLIGFNIPLNPQVNQATRGAHGDKLRYAIDFDFGLYAKKSLAANNLQFFGGAEFIQMRGLFFAPSPFSALYDPIDHLRLSLGFSVLDNLLRFSAQYYNSNLGLKIMFNVGTFQLGLGANINTNSVRAAGGELNIRFRSPQKNSKSNKSKRQRQKSGAGRAGKTRKNNNVKNYILAPQVIGDS